MQPDRERERLEERWVLFVCENPNCRRAMDVKPPSGPFTTCRECGRVQTMERIEVIPATQLEQVEGALRELVEAANVYIDGLLRGAVSTQSRQTRYAEALTLARSVLPEQEAE